MTRAGSWAAPAALQGTTSSQLLETGSHCQAPVAFLLLPTVDSVGWFVHGLVLVYPRHPAPGEAEPCPTCRRQGAGPCCHAAEGRCSRLQPGSIPLMSVLDVPVSDGAGEVVALPLSRSPGVARFSSLRRTAGSCPVLGATRGFGEQENCKKLQSALRQHLLRMCQATSEPSVPVPPWSVT